MNNKKPLSPSPPPRGRARAQLARLTHLTCWPCRLSLYGTLSSLLPLCLSQNKLNKGSLSHVSARVVVSRASPVGARVVSAWGSAIDWRGPWSHTRGAALPLACHRCTPTRLPHELTRRAHLCRPTLARLLAADAEGLVAPVTEILRDRDLDGDRRLEKERWRDGGR